MASPRIECVKEWVNHELQMAKFDPEKHLKDREWQYCTIGLTAPGYIFVVKETAEGWWRESHDFDKQKVFDKLYNDPTVAYMVTTQPRFTEPGGWNDPNG